MTQTRCIGGKEMDFNHLSIPILFTYGKTEHTHFICWSRKQAKGFLFSLIQQTKWTAVAAVQGYRMLLIWEGNREEWWPARETVPVYTSQTGHIPEHNPVTSGSYYHISNILAIKKQERTQEGYTAVSLPWFLAAKISFKKHVADKTTMLIHLVNNIQGNSMAAIILPEHTTPASFSWVQLCDPQGSSWHSVRAASVPLHSAPFSHIGPRPFPKWAPLGADRAAPQPSSLHTTWALLRSQTSSHTVPHFWSWSTSTLPEHGHDPFTSLVALEPGMVKSTVISSCSCFALYFIISNQSEDPFSWGYSSRWVFGNKAQGLSSENYRLVL